ncbi:hypothetical protein GOBAR_DD02260 [Gossypium barbadense]|nr:hypothetical protein GOBAR_DD02260 [Gossypium barbadense]
MLLKDAVYMTQPVYREHRVNSVEANQFNSNIGSSLLEDGVYTAQSVYSKRRVNLVKANNLNGHVGSSLLEDGVYKAKSVYLECRVNSLQEKTLNGHVESSLQDELLSCSPQREGLVNPGRRVTFANQFQENNGSNNFNGHQQLVAYPNLTTQSLTELGLLPRRSTHVNRQALTWNSYKANDFYKPLAPSGSQANEFQSIGNSESQQPLKNSSKLLNQVPNRPNASDSLLQHSMLTKHPVPFQLLSQNLSYQLLAESFMPLRTSTLTPNRQTNPLNVSNLQYNNSLQPRSSMLSNPRSYQLPSHQQARSQSLIPSLSKLPHDQQASTQLLMPCLSNLDLYNSKLSESSISQTLQQQKGLLNQPARAIPIYPLSRTRTGTGPPFQALSSIHYFRM